MVLVLGTQKTAVSVLSNLIRAIAHSFSINSVKQESSVQTDSSKHKLQAPGEAHNIAQKGYTMYNRDLYVVGYRKGQNNFISVFACNNERQAKTAMQSFNRQHPGQKAEYFISIPPHQSLQEILNTLPF